MVQLVLTDKQYEHIGDKTRHLMVLGSAGSGKGLSLDEVIPTPTGWVSMKELRVGDNVFDEKGDVCQVTYKSPIHNVDCYEITFENGHTIIVDKDHRWKCQTGNYTYNKVWDTEEMYLYLKKQNMKNPRGFIVDMGKPLELPEKELLIPPYVLGAWLGDGSKHFGVISNHSSDHQIIDEIVLDGFDVTDISSDKLTYTILGLKVLLRELNVLEDKHIPKEYLRASFKQRLSLLQGIMDTDGSIDKNGNCEITWADYNMVVQLRELLFTLGIKTFKIHTKYVKLDDWDEPRPYYKLNFTTDLPVFRLKRKLGRIPSSVRKTQKRRYIKQIKKVNSVPTQCITVNSKSHLFLASEEFVPTHNTIFASSKVILYALEHDNARVGVFRQTLPSLKKTAWLEIRKILEKYNIEFEENKSDGVITLTNGSTLSFIPLDDPKKVRSLNLDLVYIEQCEETSFDTYTELTLRVRNEVSFNDYGQILSVVQPEFKSHWLYNLFYRVKVDDPDYKFIHFSYLDNPYLDDETRKFYESLKDLDYDTYRTHTLGEWISGSKQIFTDNWSVGVDRDSFHYYTAGVDFGWNVPSSFVLCGWYDDECYVLDEVYQAELTVGEFLVMIEDCLIRNGVGFNNLSSVYADAASPENIEVFCQEGLNTYPSVKNVKDKIQTTKMTRIHIHPKCVNLIREMENYQWKKDKDGNILDVPVKKDDHAVDALCYSVYGVRGVLSEYRPTSNFDLSEVYIY